MTDFAECYVFNKSRKGFSMDWTEGLWTEIIIIDITNAFSLLKYLG